MGVRDGTSPLRVLIVEDSLADNGALRIALDFAARASAEDATVELFVVQPVRGDRVVSPADELRVTRGVPEGRRIRTHGAAALLRLAAAVRRSDVVLSGSEVGLGLLLGFAAARMVRRPYAVMVQAPLGDAVEHWVPRSFRAATRTIHRNVDAAICASSRVLETVVANGLARERAHLVPNGIDLARVRRLAAESPGLERRMPTFVAMGRLSPEKGFDLLIRAHAELRSAGCEHAVEILGEGPERASLSALARRLGVAETVSLPGFQENPFPRLASATAFVLTSRYEGAPLALLEALALGVPVLATQPAGVGPLLGDGGELVADSPTALAEALRRHVEFDTARTAARIHVRDVADGASDYLAILRDVAGRRSTRRRHREMACE